jgi:hypothetical protein
MKFILALVICSQVQQTCLPPYQWPETFDSQYDCLMFGYEESMQKWKRSVEPKLINMVCLLSFIAHLNKLFEIKAEMWYGELSHHNNLSLFFPSLG